MHEAPRLSARKEAARAAREKRLAAALRANLVRRKERARARAAQLSAPDAPQPGLSGTALSGKSGRGRTDIGD